jgi:predicted molibdopterin-dependent oxidoreductase YjgC
MQGIDLDKEAVTLNGNDRINGLIQFNNGFEVDENLNVMQLLMESLSNNYVVRQPTKIAIKLSLDRPLFREISYSLMKYIYSN